MTRVHVVSLPHTLLTKAYDWCAYTAKTRRFVGMLADGGHEAIVYGPDVHECDRAKEYVPVVKEADRISWFGAPEWDRDRVFDRWDAADPCWSVMNQRVISELADRWQPGDVLGVIGGACQKVLADYIAGRGGLVVEWGIGYSGVLSNSHKVYESYAWMHHVAGKQGQDDIAFYDAVIPNCFDPEDFAPSSASGNYLLYMGRPNPRKGLPIIADMAKHLDCQIFVAGQPGAHIPGTRYVGLVTGREKAELLAGAVAVLTPTTYLEPFGGVAVEAMMSGTPVIATDWGAFTETVVPGVTGYRCRTLAEFLDAVEKVKGIDRDACRRHAVAEYSTDRGAALYSDYLDRVSRLYGDGWYWLPPRPTSYSCSTEPRKGP